MAERVFTFFQGPDSGKTFVLGERPITLGRDAAREVVLRDDRASRLHARLKPDGDGAIVTDEGSSNGTFVNGVLVRERRIVPGDVIAIGSNTFVFGREPPSAAQAERLAAAAGAQPMAQGPGTTTFILPETAPPLRLNLAPARLMELMESLAEAAQPSAEARGIHISVETELEPDAARVDAQHLYRALAGLLAQFLERWPAGGAPRPGESAVRTLALRLSPDPARGGFQAEMICVGMAIPPRTSEARGETEALAFARRVAVAHGGRLEVLPTDSPGTLARLRMPLNPPDAPRPTLVVPRPAAPQDQGDNSRTAPGGQ